jgi:hypothetical protein
VGGCGFWVVEDERRMAELLPQGLMEDGHAVTFMRRPPTKLVPPSHEPLLLSKAAPVGGWRFMEKWFSRRGFVAARDARRCSGFARTATAGSAIAARFAARKPDASSAALPTAATSVVWRAGSIIATASVRIGDVTPRLS